MKRLALFAVVALASTAHAQTVPPPSGVTVVPLPAGIVAPPPVSVTKLATVLPPVTATPVALCPMPDLKQCQAAGYLRTYCGGVAHANDCKRLIQSDFTAKMSATPVTPGALGIRGARVRVQEPDWSLFSVAGEHSLSIGPASYLQLAAKKKTTPLTAAESWMILQKGFWFANQNVVASCLEYAHEKFWTFSLFQDVGAPKAGDLRAFFDAAVQSLENASLKSKDGLTSFSVQWPASAPKNRYYRGILRQGLGYPAGQAVFQFNPAVLAWVDPAGGNVQGTRNFAWHKRQSQALAAAHRTDAELEDMYVRQQHWDHLNDERQLAIWRNAARLQQIDKAAESEQWKLMSRAQANGDAGRELRALDSEIQTALIQAKVDGCLDVSTVTRCDWSPHLFADMLQTSMLQQKQDAWKACMKLTKGDFTASSQIANAHAGGLTTSCQDCTASTTKVDEYLTKFADKLRQFEPVKIDPKTKHAILGGDAGETSKKGSSDFGIEFNYGGGFAAKDFLGGVASYCKANVASYGTFDTTVRILGASFKVLASNVDLKTKENTNLLHADATLKVLGQDLVTPVNRDLATFNVVEGPRKDAKNGASTYIVIVAVPLKLEAGAAGAIGLDYGFSGSVQRNCTNANANGVLANSAAIVSKATIKPWAKLDAYASVSLDLLVAEAGIRATLTLLKVELPLDSTLEVKPYGAANKLTLVSNSQLLLDVRTLDGNIVAFVDYLGDEAQKQIVSWNGLHTRQMLFDWNSFSLPFEVANNVFQ
jgi:hypothetical protein